VSANESPAEGGPPPPRARAGAFELPRQFTPARRPPPAMEAPVPETNKLERLTQVRQQFQALAAGDPGAAMQTAKLIQDETERETALLTLVTQWKHGELRSPRERARAIDMFGLEAGLGMELADKPE